MAKPLCWITNAFDRSPSELLWVTSERWGPLKGSLLNFSYGYGKIYVVPHENLGAEVQGGMCALPIPQFPFSQSRFLRTGNFCHIQSVSENHHSKRQWLRDVRESHLGSLLDRWQ